MNEIEFQLRLHQQLCDLADTILYYHDACGRDRVGCFGGTMPARCCTRTRFARMDGELECQFLGERGCLNPNIECKQYLCDTAKARAEPELLKALAMIDIMAKQYGLIK